MKIYIASKTKHAKKWIALRNQGINIISTWIDEASEDDEPNLNSLAHRCITEAKSCDVLIAYAEPGEVMKGALIEIGAALVTGVKVIAVGPVISDSSAFIQHSQWYTANSIEEALIKFIPSNDGSDSKVEELQTRNSKLEAIAEASNKMLTGTLWIGNFPGMKELREALDDLNRES